MQSRNFLITLVINMFALAITAWIVPGIHTPASFLGLAWAALIFGFVNAVIRPIVLVLSLPFIVVTLGLFIFIVNALMLMFIGAITPLTVDSFGWALLGAVVIGVVNMILNGLFTQEESARS
jgi:putative membrane protein